MSIKTDAKELLRQHQEIIDAWFDAWLKRERARTAAVFENRRREQTKNTFKI